MNPITEAIKREDEKITDILFPNRTWGTITTQFDHLQNYLHSRDQAILRAVVEMSEKLNCTSFNIRNQDVAAYRAGYDAGVADVQEMIEKI